MACTGSIRLRPRGDSTPGVLFCPTRLSPEVGGLDPADPNGELELGELVGLNGEGFGGIETSGA